MNFQVNVPFQDNRHRATVLIDDDLIGDVMHHNVV